MIKNLIGMLKKIAPVVIFGAIYVVGVPLTEDLSDNSEEARNRLDSNTVIDETERTPLYFLDRGIIGKSLSEGKGNGIGDINGDGFMDFIRISNGKILYFQSDKKGYFFSREIKIIEDMNYVDYRVEEGSTVIIDDLNADGKKDIIIKDPRGDLRYFSSLNSSF